MNPMLVSLMKERGFVFKPPGVQILGKKPQQEACSHDWQLFKKYLGTDNRMRTHTLIIRACLTCKEKHTIDLRVN